jgi:hypothetical protein
MRMGKDVFQGKVIKIQQIPRKRFEYASIVARPIYCVKSRYFTILTQIAKEGITQAMAILFVQP